MTKSPRRLKQHVQETVGEQVRDLPLHAVRLAMFGVGRALLLSDRVTRDYKEITEGGGVKPVIGRLAGDVQTTAFKVVGAVVERVRGEDDEPEPEPAARTRVEPATRPAEPVKPAPKPAAEPAEREIAVGKPAATPKPEAKPAAEPAAKATAKPEPKVESKPEFEPKPELKPAAQAEAEKVVKDLPVPDYDSATLPQLRARLRGLSADQVKLLREYESKHAARPDVLKMYENRITKLNGLN
ncbi:hypothetical protein ACFQU9_33195 [Actinomadura namibiensis]|uniref:Uncharacterized protein n=1 Tax=Actinomadura namibiensis TaxID=182080 RepID=A0A7W3QIN4_ACTNM|nr:hypothetical protein [Actinomadura namibiensis]MBA8948506.1 hypothetical protein [Actinomadura namibiensis]